MPMLSICIPTYNRAHTLNKLLESIENEVRKYSIKYMEIIISDNASTDNTVEIVNNYINKGLPIKYFQMEENKGFGININNAVSIATGKYCWLMGSDDLVLPGAVDKLHSQINSHVDIIIGDSNTNDCHRKFLSMENGEYPISNINTLCDFIDNCTEISSFFAFISVLIIKKSFWDDISLNATVIEHPYTHQLRISELIMKSTRGITLKYLSEPIVSTGREVNEWNENIYKHLALDCATLRYINDIVYQSDIRVNTALSALVKRQYGWFEILIARAFSTNAEWSNTVQDLAYFHIKPSLLNRRKLDSCVKFSYVTAKRIRNIF